MEDSGIGSGFPLGRKAIVIWRFMNYSIFRYGHGTCKRWSWFKWWPASLRDYFQFDARSIGSSSSGIVAVVTCTDGGVPSAVYFEVHDVWDGETRGGMNSSPWKLARTSPRRVLPGFLHRNWSTRILGHWIILVLVIALSIALLPLLRVLKLRTSRRREPYVLLPVFAREYELDDYSTTLGSQLSITVNTTRRLLVHPADLPEPLVPLPPWNPYINAWKVKRHLSEQSLLFVSLNVANVSYYLDLDFRGQLIWINCKWIPEDKRTTWATWIEKLKPSQLPGPHGLHVPADETWCNKRLCEQVYERDNEPSSCKKNLCHFNVSYGKNEKIEGILIRANVVLCNNSVSVNDTNYRLMKMVFGCVYKRRSKATGKRITYKGKLGSDGVLGLNGHPLSFSRQLFDKNRAENSVLLCLAKTRSYSAGYIVFGYPLRRLGRNLPWVPLLIDKGFYEVPLINIKYGEQMIFSHRLSEGSSFDLILDGSLRFSYFTNEIFVPFVTVVKKWAQKHGYESQDIEGEEGTCWSFWKLTVREAELIHAFEKVTLLFRTGRETNPMRMFVKPENYIISPAEGLVCLAIRSSDDIQQPGTNILGGMAMKEHMIMLDEMTKRFWWMEDEDCNERRLRDLI